MVPWGNAYCETELCPSSTPGSYEVSVRQCWDKKCSATEASCFDLSKQICQHGVDECLGNRIEGCVMELYPDSHDWWPFILCFEGVSESEVAAAPRCAAHAGLDWKKIDACVSGTLGDIVDTKNAKRTTTAPHAGCPWVILNGTPMEDPSKLLQSVCQAYQGTLPAGCHK